MRAHTLLLLAFTFLFFVWSSTAKGTEDRKKKNIHKVEATTDDYDATLPVPDEPLVPLSPQPHLSSDEVETHKVVREPLPNKQIMGIDVSHYQGNINWSEVARTANMDYVYVKATEGAKLVDNTFRRNIDGARKAGLKVGIYHFYLPQVTPQQQFNNLRENVRRRDMDLIPIIDIERRGRASLAVFQRDLNNFLQMVERHYGVKPILYCSRDFYNKYLSGPFTNYKYMIARYHPEVPKLRDHAEFVMWQFSSTSYVRGIRGHVDRSCMMNHYTVKDILIP